MGFLSNFFDRFKAADFHISANLKIKTVQANFKNNFGLTLRVYKGKMLADPEDTFARLDRKTRNDVKSVSEDLEIKANLKIGDFENLILEHYGLTVQVANEHNTYCVNNKYTLGQASRKEDLKDWCKEKGFDSIEKWLKYMNLDSLDDYYAKNK
jgi:hypothetical protein